MIVDVGDTTEVRWELRDDVCGPVDPGSVTATLTGPTGVPVTLPVARPEPGTAVVQVPTPVVGGYVLRWESTGPAEADEVAIYATGPGTAAPWAPTLRAVAAHVHGRTRQAAPDPHSDYGDNEPAGTFTDLTYPTGDAVQELIGRAVAWVQGVTGTPVAPGAYPQALAAAALWAAAWVELTYPSDGTSTYSQLRADAQLATDQARAFNRGLGGGTDQIPDDPETPDAMSSWQFDPTPVFEQYGSRHGSRPRRYL